MTTGMPMKADTVLMGSVMSEGGSWVARSQSSMMPPPHTIEAGMRMRWSGLPEGHPHDVGDGETQKADGAAVGGHCSGQEDGRCEDAEPRGPDVESHGAGVVLAQQQHVERLDKRYGEGESRGEDGDEYPQFGEQHPSEASHRPYHIGFHGPFGAQY